MFPERAIHAGVKWKANGKGVLEVASLLVPVMLQDDFLCPLSLNSSWPDCWCFIEQRDLSSEHVKQLSVCAFQVQLSSIPKRKNLVSILTMVIALGRS